MLSFGPDEGPLVIAALPLFEEWNRTRAFAVAVLRALAARGIGGSLPDWPGTGESLVETRDASLAAMREAYAALADRLGGERAVYGLGIRSGCLIDGDASLGGRWQFCPQTGDGLLRELGRVRAAGGRADPTGHDTIVQIAGNLLSRERMLAALAGAEPVAGASRRVVRLSGDARAADAYLPGPPLWRRAEPDNDPALVQAVAGDIAGWIATCAG